MKVSVFFIGSIVLGVLILASAVGASREGRSGARPDARAGSGRAALFVTYAIGVVLVAQGIVGLVGLSRR